MGKGQMQEKGQVGPRAKGNWKVPKSNARYLEHPRAYHRALKDTIRKG